MADRKKGGEKKPLQEDAIVQRLGGGAPAPTGLTIFVGLLYRSSRAGYWMLYLTLDMSLCVEIQVDDIVHSERLPPDKSPFGSLGGTQVFVRKGAKITTTRIDSHTHEAGDEFDLDIKLGGSQLAPKATTENCALGTAAADTCYTCWNTCWTCKMTCITCQTNCDQATCHTCKTLCGQATCRTCWTQCNTCLNETCGVCTHINTCFC